MKNNYKMLLIIDLKKTGFDLFFGFKHYFYLCHNIVSGRNISMAKSKYYIMHLRLFQLLIVSRYFTGMKVSCFIISSVKICDTGRDIQT